MLKINTGPETAALLEQTRRAMNDLKSSVRRVASGVSIESAGDDPGGIGSVVFTETAISGIQRTLRNLNEGITVTQALTSDLNLIEDLLLTLREVAEQAASDQFTDLQRTELQEEAQSILRKIDIAVKMAGSDQGLDLTKNGSVSIAGSSELSINTQLVLTDLLVDELGKRAIYNSQRNGVFTSPLVDGSLIINGVAIRPTTQDDDSFSTSYESGSAIAKANAINVATYLTGVTAEAGPTSITGNRAISAVDLTGLNYFTLNGSVINGISVGEVDSNFQSLQKAINAETKYTGVTASVDGNGALTLFAEDGRNISIKYSNQEVLNAIGVTDKEGDLANMFGAVELGSPDRLLQGEVQLASITLDFQAYGGNVSVGGRFDAAEDYVDFVAHVVKGGDFGVAEIRIDRDPASEVTPIEDFAFIEGTVNPIIDSSGVTGDFFSTGGFSAADGSYNEGLDRQYIITATKAGTTDGDVRAEFEVTTAQGDGVVGSFVASALVDIPIAGAYTGEDVTLYFSASPRNSTISSVDAAGHEYDATVTIGGTYNGFIDSITTVEVVSSGRTQGLPLAEVQVYHDGVAFGGTIAVTGGSPLDIGNGQTITFDNDLPNFGEVIETVTGNYLRDVTVNSAPEDFTGIGAATYTVLITQDGSVDEALYVVQRDGVTLTAPATLTAGTISLVDGLSFNFPDAPPAVGATTPTTLHAEDEVDHYQDYSGIVFSGTYDGSLGESTVEVRVKQEGIVLASGESEVGRSDYALFEYRFGSDPFAGTLIASEGIITLDHGVQFELPAPSAESTLIDNDGLDQGNLATLTELSVGGYNGQISFGLDRANFVYGEDIKVVFSSASSIQIPEVPPQSDSLTVKLVSENTGTILSSTTINPVSGVTYSIGAGLTVNFLNSTGASLNFTPDAGNDDFGLISLEPGATYNGSNDNDELLFTFNNTTAVTINRVGTGSNDNVGISVGADVYNGIYGDKTLTLQLGTQDIATISLLSTGANSVNDGTSVSLVGTYTGVNAGQDIRVEYLNRVSVNLDPNPSNDDGSFSISSPIVGAQDIARDYHDLSLDIAVSKSAVVTSTSSPADVSVIGTPNGNFYGDIQIWRVNASKIRVDLVGVGAVEEKYSDVVAGDGTLDLGQSAYSGLFSGGDPGFDFNVSAAAVGTKYDFTAQEVYSYQFTDTSNGNTATSASSGGVIDLGSSTLTSTFFTSGDPGFDLTVSNEGDAVDDSYTLSWNIEPTVAIYRQSGGSQHDRIELALTLNGDQSQGTLDLANAVTGGPFDSDPGLTLVIDQPLQAEDDILSILGVSPSVSFSDGVTTIEGVQLSSSYTLSDPLFAPLFTDGSPGDVVINMSTPSNAVNDTFEILLESTSTVSVSNPDGTGSSLVTVAPDGTIDLNQVPITNLLNNGLDPGFDLIVTDLDRGIDDSYTLSLSSLPQISAQADEQVLLVNQHSLQNGDLFSADLAAEQFAIGDTFSSFVDSEHLQDGTVYTITNTLGQFNVGDVILADVTHDFKAPTYVIENSTSLINGLTLEFDPDVNQFQVGDEIRFQVRGYTGNPVASGTYTNAISPTTFTIEITNTGDVDGSAQFQYTRADTGEVVTGLSVSSSPTLLADGVYISFTAGRVYAGDQFFIDTFESLDQTFGGALSLSSESGIELELADADTDNFLGRITYNGTSPKSPGTDGNLTTAFLAINQNTAVGNVDLRTQAKAKTSVVYTENAQESLKGYQRKVALTQAELEDLSNNLEGVLTQQQDLLQEKLKVNASAEADRSAQAITQLASNAMLSSVSQQQGQAPLNILQQSLVSVAPSSAIQSSLSSMESLKERTKSSSDEKSASKRSAEQEKKREKSAERLREMMSSVEAAQRRSASAMASLSALRQLGAAHIEAQDIETSLGIAEGKGVSTPNPTGSSFNKLMAQLSESSVANKPNPATDQAREAVREAESLVREMKALALKAQTADSYDREALQSALEGLVARLKESAEAQSAQSSSPKMAPISGQRSGLNENLVFTPSLARQLGQYSSSQSGGGVDPSTILGDGDLLIQNAQGSKIPVRGTIASDDTVSVRHALGSALAKANAIKASSAQHGVSAIAGPTVAMSDSSIGAAVLTHESYFTLNGVQISGFTVSEGDSDGALRDAINELSSHTGVKATSSRDGRLRLMATDGRNITIDAYGDATKLGLTARGAGQVESRTTGGALTLSSRGFFTFSSSGLGGDIGKAFGQMSAVPVTRSLESLDLKSARGVIDALSVIELALSDLNDLSAQL